MLLLDTVSSWLKRNKEKLGKKIRPIGYKFMQLWLQKLTQVTTITYDLTRNSCEGTSISCEIIRLQFHATVSIWDTQKIYASNCGKRFLSKSCNMFTIFVCSAFIRVNIKQTEGSCLMNKAQKDSHVNTLNST